MRALLLLVLVVSTPGFAADCLVEFANVAEDADAPELVWMTYRRLLEEVGKRGLTDTKVEGLLASEDPFRFPDATGVETLAQKLAELKKLVETKEWNTPPVRAAIQANLRTWQGDRNRAARKLERIINREGVGTKIPVAVTDPLFATPDGKWLVSQSGKKVRVYDVAKDQSYDHDLRDTPSGFGLSPDGKTVAVLWDGEVVMQIPFMDGALFVSQAKETGESDGSLVPPGSAVVLSDHRVYTAGPNKGVPQFSFKIGEGRNHFKPGPYGRSGPRLTRQWGAVPGRGASSDAVFFVVKESGQQEIHEVAVGPGGEAQWGKDFAPERKRVWKTDEKISVAYSADGKRVVAHSPGMVAWFDGAAEMPTRIMGVATGAEKITGMALHPNGKEAAVLVAGKGDRIVWIDLDAQAIADSYLFPEGHVHGLAGMLSDGRLLLRNRTKSETHLFGLKPLLEKP